MNDKLKSSTACHAVIKEFEGLGPAYKKTGKIQAYICPAGLPTIGWGHTATVTHADVTNGKTITPQQAQHLFLIDVMKSENAVRALVGVELNQGQFDALVSFCFNVGRGRFGSSTLVRELNKGNYTCVPAQLRRWKYGNPKQPPLPGLVRRREMEVKLWLSK